MTAGSGFRRKERRDCGINREKWAGSENPIVDPLFWFHSQNVHQLALCEMGI